MEEKRVIYRCPYCAGVQTLYDSERCVICGRSIAHLDKKDMQSEKHGWTNYVKEDRHDMKSGIPVDDCDFIIRDSYKTKYSIMTVIEILLSVAFFISTCIPFVVVEDMKTGEIKSIKLVSKSMGMADFIMLLIFLFLPTFVYIYIVLKKNIKGILITGIISFIYTVLFIFLYAASFLIGHENIDVFKGVGYYVIAVLQLLIMLCSVIHYVYEGKRQDSYNNCPVNRFI